MVMIFFLPCVLERRRLMLIKLASTTQAFQKMKGSKTHNGYSSLPPPMEIPARIPR